jgi:hypothetical protein
MTLARDVYVPAPRSGKSSAAAGAFVYPPACSRRVHATGYGELVALIDWPLSAQSRLVPGSCRSLDALGCPPRFAHSRAPAPG